MRWDEVGKVGETAMELIMSSVIVVREARGEEGDGVHTQGSETTHAAHATLQ